MKNQTLGTVPTAMPERLEGNDRTLVETISHYSDKAVEKSKDAIDMSVKVAEEHPVKTALGAGVIGVAAGVVASKILK